MKLFYLLTFINMYKGIFSLLIIIILYLIIKYSYRILHLQKVLNYLKSIGNIKKEKNYYTFKYNNKTYFIKFLFVKRNSEIQINSKTTWQCFYNKMKSSKYLDNLKPFLDLKNDNKVIILLGKIKNIKLVINESEMIIVTPKTNVYNLNVIKKSEIRNFFENNIDF